MSQVSHPSDCVLCGPQTPKHHDYVSPQAALEADSPPVTGPHPALVPDHPSDCARCGPGQRRHNYHPMEWA